MPETRRFLTKVVLAGDKGVGKTSLIRRFVVDAFDDSYQLTLGAKVEKKVVEVEVPQRGLRASLAMSIWDIMGQRNFRELAKEAFFYGASGIFAVIDLTRQDTLDGVAGWVRAVYDVTGPIPLVLVANKKDLMAQAAYGPARVEEAARTLGCSWFLASAKTGENVDRAFQLLATLIVRAALKL